MLSGEIYGVPRKRAELRATDLLRKLDLFDRRDDRVRKFSKDMRQRLVLSMALMSEPELLFLDEPTSGLDIWSSGKIMEMLRSLNDGGTTIFLTTHNMDEANKLCTRLAIIDRGALVAIDPPEKLKAAVEGMHSVEVGFDTPVEPGKICQIEGAAEVSKQGDKPRISTMDTSALIGSLYHFSFDNNARILTLNTREPSLEDVLLKLTGENNESRYTTCADDEIDSDHEKEHPDLLPERPCRYFRAHHAPVSVPRLLPGQQGGTRKTI
jgi:ABC-2 type transport system ATP-binding protein